MTLTVAPLTDTVVTLSDFTAMSGGGAAVEFSSSLAGLKVTAPTSGLSVVVKAGTARYNGLRFTLSVDTTATVTANASSYTRIDAVVVWVDLVAQTSGLAVVAGTPQSSPSAPLITLNAGDWGAYPNRVGLVLGYVTVTAGMSNVLAASIADRRAVSPVWTSGPLGVLGTVTSTTVVTVPTVGYSSTNQIPNGSGGAWSISVPYLPASRYLRIAFQPDAIWVGTGETWTLQLRANGAPLKSQTIPGTSGYQVMPELVIPYYSTGAGGAFAFQVMAQSLGPHQMLLGAPVWFSVTDLGRSVPTDWS